MFINKNKLFFVMVTCIISGLVLVSNSQEVFAYSATLTTGTDIKLNVSPSGDGTSIHEESINVVSDCRAGYNLSIATPEGSNLYTNGDGSTTAVFTAVDGTSALNSTNNTNKWGYTLTTNPTSSTVFSPLSTTPSILKTVSQTASSGSDINDTFSINYGVKVDNTIAPGSYKMANNGTIVYYLTMATTCNSYIVQYQGNNADNPNGMGTTDSSTGEKSVKQINIERDTKITLLPSNFKKAGYGFLGWSTDQDAYTHFTDNDNTNDPIIYGPMEDVVIDSTIVAAANNRNQINMYAVWVPALKDGSNNTVYFQDWDNPNTTLPNDGCSTLTQTVFDDSITNEKGKITVTKNSFVALTDKRDNEVYTVARLADGNCWMTENLRLEHEGTVENNINDPTVTNQSLSQGYGGTTGTYGNFVGLAASESANFSDSTASLSFADGGIYKSDDSGDVFNSTNSTLEDIGTSNYPGYRFPRYNSNNTQNLVDSITYTQNYAIASSPSDSGTNYRTSSNIYGYGNYYTWAAAMANTNYYTSSSTSEVVNTSICPTGWHLPSSNDGTAKEYSILSQRYGGTGSTENGVGSGDTMSNRFRTFPNNFLYSGNSSLDTRGKNGYYWSRSANNSNYSYDLYLHSTSFGPSDYSFKYAGFSVRCLIGSADVQVALDSNNGTGAVSRAFGAAGSAITLPSSSNPSAAIAKPGYVFKNWNTAPDGSGTSYTSNFTIPAGSTGETLYAQWTPQYGVTYVNNCYTFDTGCALDKSETTSSQNITLTSVPSTGTERITLGAYNKFIQSGYKIKSWNTAADGSGVEYTLGSTYTVPVGAVAGDSIRLYAQWVPVYTVKYEGNGADHASDNGEMTLISHSNVGEGDYVDLFASNFSRSGYAFAGWSLEKINTTSSFAINQGVANGSYVIYGPNETFHPDNTFSSYADSQNVIHLHAVWVAPENNVTMQSFDPTILAYAEMANGSIIALRDERDSNVYLVAKLADGNWWMAENIRLDDSSILTTSNTNNPLNDGTDATLTQAWWLSDSITLGSPTITNHLSPSLINLTAGNPYESLLAWCTSGNANCYDQSLLNNWNTLHINLSGGSGYSYNYKPSLDNNVTTNSQSVPSHANLVYSTYNYGNYYNWYAATAGNGTYSRTSGNVAGDICPAGWHLPYGDTGTGTGGGNTSGGFSYLGTKLVGTGNDQQDSIASQRWRAYPNNFVYSGLWVANSPGERGGIGFYWSSSAYSSNVAYSMLLVPNGVVPGQYSSRNKYSGLSVRCVAHMPSTVTVRLNQHVESVSFTDYNNNVQTINTDGKTVKLTPNIPYTISATYQAGYTIDTWSTTAGGNLGSASADPTTYKVTGNATLSINAKNI